MKMALFTSVCCCSAGAQWDTMAEATSNQIKFIVPRGGKFLGQKAAAAKEQYTV